MLFSLYLCAVLKNDKLMATRNEVEQFLSQFKVKLDIWGIVFLDGREKNMQALADLNISRFERLNEIRTIEVEHYSDGPIRDVLNDYGEMWVFGKDVNGIETYIKITLGKPNLKTICISFHQAEHPMTYPLKQNKEDK